MTNWQIEGPINVKIELEPKMERGPNSLFSVTWQREGETQSHCQLCSGFKAFQEDDLPGDVLEAIQPLLLDY